MATLADMAEWLWVEYLREKEADGYSEYEDTLFQIIWSITNPKTSLASIRRAIERVDGKQPENIEFEYPKFYLFYPNATSVAGGEPENKLPSPKVEVEMPAPEMPTAGIRGAIKHLASQPKGTALRMLELAKRMMDEPYAEYKAPLKVKEVIAAALIVLSKTKQLAMDELLNQIDGKVAVTFKLLGDDVYITRYETIAPAGAVKNSDGVYQIEADNVTNAWVARLAAENDKRK